ncbi:SEA (Seh1-associated) complex subunit [Coemansia sp. RSA 1843]|nr:SEA (Seh1-associated) complex subunit [Coemansia sp. RSA 1843]
MYVCKRGRVAIDMQQQQQQRATGSGGRRNAGKAGKNTSSGGKPTLEPLPELPDSSAAEDNAPAEAPIPEAKQAKPRASPRNTGNRAASTSSKPDISFGSVVPDSGDIKAPRSAGTVTEHKKTPLDEPSAGADNNAVQQANLQRPRSRTASPWRGRGRGAAGGIFVRNTHHRQNVNRQNLGVAHGSGQSGSNPYKYQHGQSSAGANSGSANDGSMSAGVVPANSNSTAVDASDAAPRDTNASLSTAQRRRGQTLDPEYLATRKLSPTSTDGSVNGDRKALAPNLHPALSATTPHFSISTSNAALARYEDKHQSQVLVSRPARPVKTDSGSSDSTVQTVEIKHSPQSSVHSIEQMTTVPRGQLSKILYKETSATSSANGSGGSQFSPEGSGNNNNNSGAESVASAVSAELQSVNPAGRTKRGGSGGESRLGDYKGALVRPPPQSVFGNRARQSTAEIGHALKTADEGEQRARDIAHSGPQEIPGAYISQAGSNQSVRQSLRQSQGSAHNVRSGRSPGDEIWDISNGSKPPGRPAARDTSQGAQQTRNTAQQGRNSRGTWIYTPPGDRLATDSTAAAGMITGTKIQPFLTTPRTAHMTTMPSITNANVLSTSGIANTASTARTESSSAEHQRLSKATDVVLGAELLHHRRSSNASTRAMPINIDESSIIPHLNPTGSDMVFGVNRKVTSGSSSGKLDSVHSGGYSSDPLNIRNGSTKPYDSLNGRVPASPWSFIPSSGKKRTLKFHYSGRWNAIAASPNNEPRAAVAGREGLFVFDMGPDKISQQNYVSSGRRRSMATDFKDVIWRPSDYIITGSNDGTVSIWDPTRWSESMLRKYNEIARPVNRLAHKPDDPNFVYSAFSDGSIIGWDIRAPNRAAGLRITASLSPNDIDCNPLDANMIAAISNEGRISIWDIRKLNKPLDGFSAHSASTGQCIAWHPNGRLIASSGTDSLIKVWDMKSSSSSKRYSGTAYCTIKTLVNVHRLQWRPGYDTQISSCAFVNENHLQVWDMHNPNHSLFYHDKHADKITGFTWFDDNLVWSVGRDSNIIQCDMESDSIYTSGLLGNTVVDFSLSSYVAIATGSSSYRHDGCFAQSKPLYPHGPSLGLIQRPTANTGSYGNHSERNTSTGGGQINSGKSTGSVGDGINMAIFQARLPESYVDEHKLDPSIEVKSLAISELAKRYRYDPDAFRECCEENSKAAASVGLADVSGFWQLLSVAFGDALPLAVDRKTAKTCGSKASARTKRRLKKQQRSAASAASSASATSAATAEAAVEMTAANAPGKDGGDAASIKLGGNSTATSRSSSAMFASKSVIDSLPEGHSSDDEPYSKFGTLESMANMSQQLTSTSTQPRQQRTFGASVLPTDRMVTDNTNALQKFETARQGLSTSMRGLGLGTKLERKRISMSHTNLQQAATSNRTNGRLPSPFSRTTEHSLSSSSGAFASEPVTPLQKVSHHTFHDNNMAQTESSLISAFRITGPGGYLKGPSNGISKNKETLTHGSTLKIALQNAASSTLAAGQTASVPNVDSAGLGITTGQSGSLANNRASATDMLIEKKLQIGAQKRTTKTELKMAIESCQYYADIGDVQTAVTAALLLRNFIQLPNWTVAEAWFWAYVEQLDSYREYALATEILLASPFERVREPILEYNTITMNCSQCGAQLAKQPDVGMSLCTVCKRKSNSCVVCQEPVTSRFIWCQGCGHGGHANHMAEWFDEMKQGDCPSGCGHICQPLFSASPQ